MFSQHIIILCLFYTCAWTKETVGGVRVTHLRKGLQVEHTPAALLVVMRHLRISRPGTVLLSIPPVSPADLPYGGIFGCDRVMTRALAIPTTSAGTVADAAAAAAAGRSGAVLGHVGCRHRGPLQGWGVGGRRWRCRWNARFCHATVTRPDPYALIEAIVRLPAAGRCGPRSR